MEARAVEQAEEEELAVVVLALHVGEPPGQLLPHVSGDSTLLGLWDPTRAVPMEREGGSWKLSFVISANQGLAFKFALLDAARRNQPIVESGPSRQIVQATPVKDARRIAIFPEANEGKSIDAFMDISVERIDPFELARSHLVKASATDLMVAATDEAAVSKLEGGAHPSLSHRQMNERYSMDSASPMLSQLSTPLSITPSATLTPADDNTPVDRTPPLLSQFIVQTERPPLNIPTTTRNNSHVLFRRPSGDLTNGGSRDGFRIGGDDTIVEGDEKSHRDGNGDAEAEERSPEPFTPTSGQSAMALLPRERRRLAIILVGLPARGKSYTAAKLTRYLRWLGHDTRNFNVGRYRRRYYGASQLADFFSGDNQYAKEARWKAAEAAMNDMLDWMIRGGQVGVFDATNSTVDRRQKLKEVCDSRCKIIFLESICTDAGVIEANAREKIRSSPDYIETTDHEAALEDFKNRLRNYETVYEPVQTDEGSYIKLIDMHSGEGQIQINAISGYLQSRIVFFLLNIHITPRPIYLTRHGESMYNLVGKIGGDTGLTERGQVYSKKLAAFIEERLPAGQACSVWTSTLRRTIQTAEHFKCPKVQWRALDEINAGNRDGMTYEEIKQQFPEEYAERKKDKLRYRYPCGESYLDVIQRLEPVIIELERQRSPVVVIAHQAVIRSLYAYFMNQRLRDIPFTEIPLHTVIELTAGSSGIMEKRFNVGV
eukprot:jgi/Chlat1/8291/Chrsp78S07733